MTKNNWLTQEAMAFYDSTTRDEYPLGQNIKYQNLVISKIGNLRFTLKDLRIQ